MVHTPPLVYLNWPKRALDTSNLYIVICRVPGEKLNQSFLVYPYLQSSSRSNAKNLVNIWPTTLGNSTIEIAESLGCVWISEARGLEKPNPIFFLLKLFIYCKWAVDEQLSVRQQRRLLCNCKYNLFITNIIIALVNESNLLSGWQGTGCGATRSHITCTTWRAPIL